MQEKSKASGKSRGRPKKDKSALEPKPEESVNAAKVVTGKPRGRPKKVANEGKQRVYFLNRFTSINCNCLVFINTHNRY